MLIPLSWLKKYVPVALPPKELAHRLTMAGTEIDNVQETGSEWAKDKVLVGHVLRVDPHPDADRLTLPTVDLGKGETATVVCGAPNVAVGQKIAFAREGAMLFSYRSGAVEPLKAAKIRGVLSAGMVCSELELGMSEEHEGILVLEDDAPIGTPLVDYLGDAIFDAEVTPNRPDCLSILGIAHEVAALTGETCTEPGLEYPEEGAPIEEQVKVDIADPDLCSRYAASLISGVKVGASPGWLQDALVKVGLRPINNIVDVTNYVMLEYGQPLHAFDLETIKDNTIIVRAARPGETLDMLDGESRRLEPPMLAIADSQDAVALAGVMGGTGTGVTDGTTSVLVESANFDPINTRRTAAALRLGTDASYRFERGIRADLVPRALRRATQLILQVAGGRAAKGIVDVHPVKKGSPVVDVTRHRMERVLGVDVGMGRARKILESLGFKGVGKANTEGQGWEMSFEAPYWRADINIEDDVVEEVARVIGYDEIPTTMLSAPVPHHKSDTGRQIRELLRDALVSAGMQEVVSYSLTDRQTLSSVQPEAGGPEPMGVANPLSSEAQYLRTSLRGSVLGALASNRRISHDEGLRLFEIGRVFLPRPDAKERELPDERQMLVGVLSGPRSQAMWLGPQGDMDFFDAKGTLEPLFAALGMDVEYGRSQDAIMHPGKTASLTSKGETIGTVGEVRQGTLRHFAVDERPAAMFEIDLEALTRAAGDPAVTYEGASRYPESERDLALIVDADVPSANIQRIIERHKLVKGSSPFDVYSGEGIPPNQKSVAYRVAFQSDRSTLTADLVDRAQGDILRQLQRELGAELRE